MCQKLAMPDKHSKWKRVLRTETSFEPLQCVGIWASESFDTITGYTVCLVALLSRYCGFSFCGMLWKIVRYQSSKWLTVGIATLLLVLRQHEVRGSVASACGGSRWKKRSGGTRLPWNTLQADMTAFISVSPVALSSLCVAPPSSSHREEQLHDDPF